MAHASEESDQAAVYGIRLYMFEPESDPEQEADTGELVEQQLCLQQDVSEWYVHFEWEFPLLA